MQKISKTQFLELVDLSIACRGAAYLFEKGRHQPESAFENSLDDAIAEYVFWGYDSEGNREGDPEIVHFSRIYKILTPWVEGYEKDQ